MQMELSHKRARVELERAASTSARCYEVGASRWPRCWGVVHGACQAIRQVSLLAGSLDALPLGYWGCLVRPQIPAMLDVLEGAERRGWLSTTCARPGHASLLGCLFSLLPPPHPKNWGVNPAEIPGTAA